MHMKTLYNSSIICGRVTFNVLATVPYQEVLLSTNIDTNNLVTLLVKLSRYVAYLVIKSSLNTNKVRGTRKL